MPFTTGVTIDGINRIGVPANSSVDERQIVASRWMAAGASAIRSGITPGSGAVMAHGGSPEQWSITAFRAVVSDGAGGAYEVTVTTTKSENMPTRPGSGTSRYDILVIETFDTGAAAGRYAKLRLYYGTASSSPSLAATTALLPANAFVLGSMLVPNAGAPTITQGLPRTVTVGSTLPLATAAERTTLDASGALYKGIRIFREDLGLEQINPTGVAEATTAGSWVTLPPAVAPHFRGYAAAAGTLMNTNANMAFIAEEDTEGGWGGAAYTVKRAGIYRVTCQVQPNTTTAAGQQMNLQKNGTLRQYMLTAQSARGNTESYRGEGESRFAVSDVISVTVAAALTTNAVPVATPSSVLAIDWLRP